MAEKKNKLGRGLSALLGETNDDYAKLDSVRTSKPVAIELLHPGKYQPRHHVDQNAIEALAQSIREKGILQPLLVRPIRMMQMLMKLSQASVAGVQHSWRN